MSQQDVKVITTKLPTYLEALLQKDASVKLVYREKKKVELQQPLPNEIIEISHEVSDLDLTGSPLDTDLGGIDNICGDILERPFHWTKEEGEQCPLSLNEARTFINDQLKSKKPNESIFCICDGCDNQRTVGLGVTVTPTKISRILVHILPCCQETDDILTADNMKKDHIKSARQNVNVNVLNVRKYSLFGYNLKNCNSLLNADYNGNVSVEISQNNSDATLNLQVIVGHSTSPLITFWKELCIIQAYIKQLENVQLLNDSTVITAENYMDSEELITHITDLVNNVSTTKKMTSEILDLKNLRPMNILDKLWNILKYCNTLSDLRDSFHFFFEELAEKQSATYFVKEDKSAVGEIVNGILEGKIAVANLSFNQSLELLLELGLEKLKNDYFAIINNLFGIVTDTIVKKWNEFKCGNSFNSQNSARRKTRISINPKLAITDLKNNKIKFSYLDTLHKLTEFMFLYKDNLPSLEEAFDNFGQSLCDKFIVKFQNIFQERDIGQPILCLFSCSISSICANRFIKDASPVAITTKLMSCVNMGQITTVFHFSQYPIFPPSVFDKYDIKLESQQSENSFYYVTKLVNYVHNIS